MGTISHFKIFGNNPDGHWLRKKYLGIEAELLSEHLFRELCQKSLLMYYKNELFSNSDQFVQRKKQENIESGIKTKNPSVEFLVGESGFGKSTIAYTMLESHIKSGGLGLWIRPEYIESSISIESMICKVLRELYPSLSIDIENTLLDIVENNSKILLVIDDVNQAENSNKIVHKILSWSSRGRSRNLKPEVMNFPYLFICPIWPYLWFPLSLEFEHTEWIRMDFIDTFNQTEARDSVHLVTKQANLNITNFMADNLAKKLGYDPFLINSFSRLIRGEDKSNLNNLAEDVIQKYIQKIIYEISYYSRDTLSFDEYENLLSIIFVNILRKKCFIFQFMK